MSATGFPLLTLEKLFSLELPELEYVVDELLPLGHAGLFSAREKAGKGLLAIDLCASVALGEPFLDRATRPGPAIYAAAEEHVRDVRDRIANRLGTERAAPLSVLSLDGSMDDRLDLADVESMQRLYDMVLAVQPVLVVLDVLRELHDRTEDSSDEMGPLLRPLRQLAHATNTALLVTHHQRKAGGFRGSTAIKAAFDFEWALTSDGDNDGPPAGILRVEGRHGPRRALRIQFGERGRWEVRQPAGPGVVAPDRILRHLETVDAWQTAREIALATGTSLPTVRNELGRLLALDPCPLDAKGTGHRNDPRRYRAVGGDDSNDYYHALSLSGSFGSNQSAEPASRHGTLVPSGPQPTPAARPVAATEQPQAATVAADPDAPDPALLRAARNICDLSPAEQAEYRAQLAAAPDDDPHLAHDRAALALADRLLAVSASSPGGHARKPSKSG